MNTPSTTATPEPTKTDAYCGLGACTFDLRVPCPGTYDLELTAKAPDLPLDEEQQAVALTVSDQYITEYYEWLGGTAPECP